MRNKCLRHFLCKIRIYFHKYKSIYQHTVELRYLELAYFELPLISKWKSGPCFNIILWQPVTKYCGKEEKSLLRSNFSSFPHYFIYKFLTSGVKLHIQLLNVVVQFIVFLTLSTLISRSDSVSPLELEITRFDCIWLAKCTSVWNIDRLGRAMRKRVFWHLWTTETQTSLRIHTSWSGPLLSFYRMIGHCRA